MFSKNSNSNPNVAPPAVLITPATACEEGGRCSRMDFVLEAQHVRQFLVTWGRDAEKFKEPYKGVSKRLEGFRLGSKAAKYIQRFAEKDTSSRIVLSNNNGNGDGECAQHCGCDLPLLTALAWWFSETLKSEKPERRVVRYFFGTNPSDSGEGKNKDSSNKEDAKSKSDKEALDFLYSIIWQLVRAFPHGQTSAQGVVISALTEEVSKTLSVDDFRAQVKKLDGTMATFGAGLDLLRTCVQVAGDHITYVFDGLEPVARDRNNKATTPPRGYDPVLHALLESSHSKVHSVWVSTKENSTRTQPAPACKFQKDAGRPEKEFGLEPSSSDSLLRAWRTVSELKFKGNRYY
ncbi:uncharacterized protein PG986_004905 [Apiospora aurea]|uniref:Uncharacterized protein n=1 Tax=Apiospora aurea TaxID=335848 RepID=A0ABR1QG25_9PEZI